MDLELPSPTALWRWETSSQPQRIHTNTSSILWREATPLGSQLSREGHLMPLQSCTAKAADTHQAKHQPKSIKKQFQPSLLRVSTPRLWASTPRLWAGVALVFVHLI